MLTTDEWLVEHRPCLAVGETHTIEPSPGPWFLLVCLCTARHLCHIDEWPRLEPLDEIPGDTLAQTTYRRWRYGEH